LTRRIIIARPRTHFRDGEEPAVEASEHLVPVRSIQLCRLLDRPRNLDLDLGDLELLVDGGEEVGHLLPDLGRGELRASVAGGEGEVLEALLEVDAEAVRSVCVDPGASRGERAHCSDSASIASTRAALAKSLLRT
jgi:hypothetical protein